MKPPGMKSKPVISDRINKTINDTVDDSVDLIVDEEAGSCS